MIIYRLQRGRRMVIVVAAPEPWDDDGLVGLLTAEAVHGRRYVSVWEVDVLPSHQRQGIATRMVRELHKALPDRIVPRHDRDPGGAGVGQEPAQAVEQGHRSLGGASAAGGGGRHSLVVV